MLTLYFPVVLFIVFAYALWYSFHAVAYYSGAYYKERKRPFLLTVFDKGAYGEYLTYNCLRSYERDGARFLFNCYLPKKDNETSEIDVLMIHASGIYVFESKNYSGWIFGSEKNKMWTQSLPQRRGSQKKFYNPIMQNRTHVRWLRNQIGDGEIIHNIVVFSERCSLKRLEVTSKDVTVVKRDSLLRIVRLMSKNSDAVITVERVEEIYDKLLPFTRVSKEVKSAHIDAVRRKHGV